MAATRGRAAAGGDGDTATALPPEAFAKEDATNDALFYRSARMVTHVDDAALAALTAHYAARLAPGADVLDLMSSWVSHLPSDLSLGRVTGHGMNAEELAANRRLDAWFVRDLNRDPRLSLAQASQDAVLVCAGVQYLQRPAEVFREVRRILRPGGQVIVAYANRCFPTKAVAAWLALDMAGRAALVEHYLEAAGFGAVRAAVLADGQAGDALVAVEGVRAG